MKSTLLTYGQSGADFRHLSSADARRMEAAEEHGALRYAQAVAPLHPEWGTAWEEFAGGHLVFVQRMSPVGRAHGMGFCAATSGKARLGARGRAGGRKSEAGGEDSTYVAARDAEKNAARQQATEAVCKVKITPEAIAHVEDFYFSREADAQVDVCPYADPSLFAALNERGFQVAEFNQTLARWISPDEELVPASDLLKNAGELSKLEVRSIEPGEAQEWSAISARVFFGDQWQQWQELFKPWAGAPDSMNLAAFADGQMVGMAGGLVVREYNMAGFWGASVLPEFRGRGIQRAFLQERLRLAQQAGCDLAVTLTLPGTASQRNAERAGFRTAYTKVVCIKRHPEGKGVYVEVGYSK
ncbi:MAG: GNAT family N-acetyltransferase [Acidobacteriia bacterium]|nr:GNAT family N-acetyltransferase [Terriglobia bacterium]